VSNALVSTSVGVLVRSLPATAPSISSGRSISRHVPRHGLRQPLVLHPAGLVIGPLEMTDWTRKHEFLAGWLAGLGCVLVEIGAHIEHGGTRGEPSRGVTLHDGQRLRREQTSSYYSGHSLCSTGAHPASRLFLMVKARGDDDRQLLQRWNLRS
jgi:hypothetical protein